MNRRRAARRSICLLAALSVLIPTPGVRAGGLVDDDLKRGAAFEERGELQRAAEAYSRVLRLEPGNRKAKTGLGRVAGPAIAARLTTARSLEATLRFTDAQAELEAAIALQERVLAAGITLDASLDAAAAHHALIDRWVDQLYDEAVAAQDDRMWSAAVAHLRRIESLRPGYRDVRPRLIEVWAAWGAQEVDLGMYRSAADRFAEASRVPGFTNDAAADRAAVILAALGAHELEKGACRESVRDLRAAQALVPEAVQPVDLERAETCALTCLSLVAGADPETGLELTRVEQIAADLRRLIADRSSRFLTVIRRDAKDPGPCDLRPSAGSSGAPATAVPRRLRAAVEVTSQAMHRSPATSRNSESRSQQRVDDQVVGERVVVIRLYEEVFSGSMTGTITLTDQKSGRSGPPIPIRVTGEATAQWVKNPPNVFATGTAARPTGTTARPGVPGLDRLVRIDDQRTDAQNRLRDSLISDFIVKAADIILETVDAEPGISDPVTLDLGFPPASAEGTDTNEAP